MGVDPAGSDMWVAEASDAGSVSLRWSDQPGRWQLLAAGVGEEAVRRRSSSRGRARSTRRTCGPASSAASS
ncbi:hypothetical protein [Cellulosimicrobium sp. CUA-896]|uniref:hypothetical protein n=1 Tax=Cellulosimicrobium sp. CUA-896 TaxID=1517881 RepID=UPI000964F11B|nr:hypothetical protein [Cellulosimicrobium sp. CUA-896]OLT45534.1 hypothetical protein BJF88_05740 [Cellulosimicrobium sp. CUA-896]